MTARHDNALTLRESIDGFADALMRSDVDAASRFVTDDLTVISLDGGLKTLDRAWWAAMVPHFRLEAFDMRSEVVVERGDEAIDYRYAAMTSRVGSAERSGVFCITDHWERRDGVWRVWQRHSVPVVDSARLPETF